MNAATWLENLPLMQRIPIFVFELWLFLAGLCSAIDQPGTAAFSLSWNAVRLYLSPFLKFSLARSIPFILARGVAASPGGRVLITLIRVCG